MAAAIAVCATLTLGACGGSTGANKIDGADSLSPNPSVSPSADHSKPDLSLPKDFEMAFDFEEPSKPDHAAALKGAENYLRALKHGIAQQDPNDPAYGYYSTSGAKQYAKKQIKKWVSGGWTVNGEDRYYRADTQSIGHGERVVVALCRNQAKSYSKNVKTGKVHYTDEDLSSYQKFQILMNETSGIWKAQGIEVWGKSKECRS